MCSLEAIGEPAREHCLCTRLGARIWGGYGDLVLRARGASTCPEAQWRARWSAPVFVQRARNTGIVRRRTLSRSATSHGFDGAQRMRPTALSDSNVTRRGHGAAPRSLASGLVLNCSGSSGAPTPVPPTSGGAPGVAGAVAGAGSPATAGNRSGGGSPGTAGGGGGVGSAGSGPAGGGAGGAGGRGAGGRGGCDDRRREEHCWQVRTGRSDAHGRRALSLPAHDADAIRRRLLRSAIGSGSLRVVLRDKVRRDVGLTGRFPERI